MNDHTTLESDGKPLCRSPFKHVFYPANKGVEIRPEGAIKRLGVFQPSTLTGRSSELRGIKFNHSFEIITWLN